MKVKAQKEYHIESTQYKSSLLRTCPTGIWKYSQNCKAGVCDEVLF